MKVIFLDFDGVLNSAASFVMETRKRNGLTKKGKEKIGPVNQTLCHVCTSNFQLILDHFPELKIVISSTWRELFDMEWLRDKLQSYGIDSSRIIDKTPTSYAEERGVEIGWWLEKHPEVKDFVIVDDNFIGGGYGEDNIVLTTWDTGLTLEHVYKIVQLLGGNPKKLTLPR